MITRFAPQASTVRFKTFNFQPTQPKAPTPPAAPKPPQPSPLPAFQRARLRAKVAAITCSEPWTETAAALAEQHGLHPKLATLETHLAQRGIYPPKPDPGPHQLPRTGAVRMRRCQACRRLVPPNNLASFKLLRLCDDCRIQPETDPDEPANSAGFPRSPGKRRRTLVEGSLIDDDTTPARKQLLRIGLTNSQITVLALANDGYTLRAIAELCHWNASYVHKLLRSAKRTLRHSGLVLPTTWGTADPHRANRINPQALDAMSARVI